MTVCLSIHEYIYIYIERERALSQKLTSLFGTWKKSVEDYQHGRSVDRARLTGPIGPVRTAIATCSLIMLLYTLIVAESKGPL